MKRVIAAIVAVMTVGVAGACSFTVPDVALPSPGTTCTVATTGTGGSIDCPVPTSAAPTSVAPSPTTPAPTTPAPTTPPPAPGWPDYASTGAPVETGLPSGPCTLAANMTYNAMLFNCSTLEMAAGSKVTNSVITGFVRDGAGSFTIEDSTINRSGTCIANDPAVAFDNYTLRRVHIKGFNDGVRAEGPNVKVYDSLIENCFQNDGHADGLQICAVASGCGGEATTSGLVFDHNTVMHPRRDSTAAVFVMGGVSSDYQITDNLMMGYTITARLHVVGTFTGNRLVTNGGYYDELDSDDVCTGNGGIPLSGMTMSDNRLVTMVGTPPPSQRQVVWDFDYAPNYDVASTGDAIDC